MSKVQQQATQRVQQQYPQYAGNPMIMSMIEPQVGQQLVQQQILLDEAAKLGIHASDADVRQFSADRVRRAEVLFPGGKFIGQEQYASLIQSRFDMYGGGL